MVVALSDVISGFAGGGRTVEEREGENEFGSPCLQQSFGLCKKCLFLYSSGVSAATPFPVFKLGRDQFCLGVA